MDRETEDHIRALLKTVGAELRERADQLDELAELLVVAVPAEDAVVTEEPPVGQPPIAWGAKVSQVFRERVWWIANAITASQKARFDPNWLMGCMAWESGESFSASKKNMAGSGATGLIQFMPTTATGLGTTTAKLAAMTAEDQLNYVYKYFRDIIQAHGPITTLEDCYMAILWPSAVGKPASYGLFDRSKKPTTYRQNAGLDSNKDGVVTKFEAASHVREKLSKGMQFTA